jgi:hypothetical protein
MDRSAGQAGDQAMLGYLNKPGTGEDDAVRRGRVCDVGWLLKGQNASFIWDEPKIFRRDNQEPKSAKAVQNCPSVVDFESRHWVIPCPVDATLALAKDKEGKLVIRNLDGAQAPVAGSHLGKLVHINGSGQWRHPNRPVLQISTPYYFISDEVCWMSQLPPYLTYRDPQWPGVMIGGRLPIHVWPRIMMWAFEWHDPSKPLVLRRGEPWFMVRFETDDPTRPVRLFQAEWTPEMTEYAQGAEAVTNYVKRTFSLFKIAEKRRPTKLLKRANRGAAQFSRETGDV